MNGAYLNKEFEKHIDGQNVEIILELGSRDGLDAIILSDYYGADVYAFECNPSMVSICESNTNSYQRVKIIDKAVWDENCQITFYPVINGNVGASSCFVISEKYPENIIQEVIVVEAIRLDDWIREQNISVDMLCIDLQGAELKALQGMGAQLDAVKYIITEGQNKPIYEGVALIDEIEEFLVSKGFHKITSVSVNSWFGDYLFARD